MALKRIFRNPRDIVWGRGSLGHLEAFRGEKVLIVTDRVMTALGVTARAADYLRKGCPEVRIFDAVEPEPSITTVMELVRQYGDFAPRVILGLGGGSAIDASKAFRIFWEHPELTFEDVRYLKGPAKAAIPPFRKTVHVAVPSTSGTGSEASYACVLNDPALGVKCPILDPALIPDMAIIDPDLADTMPPALLADSGLDALTHAVESYVNVRANDFSKGLSMRAITLIMKYLPRAYRAADPVAKEHMHYAATIAGMAFSNSANGICHSIADKVGAAFKLSHGRANAIALPFTIQFNRQVAGDLFAEMAVATGFVGSDTERAVDDFIRRVQKLKKDLDMPENYRQAGIAEDRYFEGLDMFATESLTFGPTLVNPRKPTLEEMRTLFTACYG